MKKIFSGGIILFVFLWIASVGILIMRQAFTSGVSNAQLIANLIYDGPSPSTVQFVHLAAAMSDISQPQPLATAPGTSFTKITVTTGTISTDTTTTISEQELEVLAATLVRMQISGASSQ